MDVYRAQRLHTTVPAIALSGGQIKGEKSWFAVRGVRRPTIANLSFDCVKTSKLLVFHTNDLYLRLKSASGIPGTYIEPSEARLLPLRTADNAGLSSPYARLLRANEIPSPTALHGSGSRCRTSAAPPQPNTLPQLA